MLHVDVARLPREVAACHGLLVDLLQVVPHAQAVRDDVVAAVAGDLKVPRLEGVLEGLADELQGDGERARPVVDDLQAVERLASHGGEATPLDELARQLSESVALLVPLEGRANHHPVPGVAVHGGTAVAVAEGEGDQPAQVEDEQVAVGEVRRGEQRGEDVQLGLHVRIGQER
jgi:hypothetical protein